MLQTLKNFLKVEAAGGVALLVAAVLGVIAANSPVSEFYLLYRQPFIAPVNDGLMAIFFLLVGMEMRREFAVGELSTRDKALLPLVGALGGVVVPALIYIYFNHGTEAASGWAIPSATDIAFSLGVLALLGSRVPFSLKIFLLALATIDDIAAILIIATYYTAAINWMALLGALACIIIIWKCALEEVMHSMPYFVLGALLWVAIHESGVHATVAGVILGLMLPLQLSEKWVEKLHGWVAFGIVPLFAFVNSGLVLAPLLDISHLTHAVPLGISLGLAVGKPLGIFAVCFLCIKCGLAKLPEGANWVQLLGVSMIAGIGFTMSLFIGYLSFQKPEMQDFMRMGVVVGSLVSVMLGATLLKVTSPHVQKA